MKASWYGTKARWLYHEPPRVKWGKWKWNAYYTSTWTKVTQVSDVAHRPLVYCSMHVYIFLQYSPIQTASVLLRPWVWEPVCCVRLGESGRLGALCFILGGRDRWERGTGAEMSVCSRPSCCHMCYTGNFKIYMFRASLSLCVTQVNSVYTCSGPPCHHVTCATLVTSKARSTKRQCSP
jgi:hypothetical protein